MTSRRKFLLILLVSLIAVIRFFWSQIPIIELPFLKTHRFAGPLDQPDRINQAQMAHYALEEIYPLFSIPMAESNDARQIHDSFELGAETAFWVSDSSVEEAYLVTSTLRYAGPGVLMYVDQNIQVDQKAIEDAAHTFETTIVPQTRAMFGQEDAPAERPTILHTALNSAGGYFSAADALPRALNPDSNERKMFVIGVDSYPPGTEAYLSILAHEFQHMIHANQQPKSPSWFNEGLSTLSQDLNGYPDDEMALIYLADPDHSLIHWEQDAAETGSQYGAVNLFFRYFNEQYLEGQSLERLIHQDAGNHLQVFTQIAAEERPDIQNFPALAADWAVANLINDPQVGDGRFAYRGLPAYVSLQEPDSTVYESWVSQLGVDYLGVFEGPHTILFNGEEAVPLTGAQPAEGDWMWWSNRGDGKYATLTRSFDLSATEHATLNFFAWYEIERHYDYAYVTVSIDGGRTWQTLPGKATTRNSPHRQNLGDGLTGVSGHPETEVDQGQRGRWIEEQVDLSSYAGQKILLRFWLVNDGGYNAQGLLLDQICIQEIGYCDSAEDGDGDWQAQGFVRTTGGIPQTWEIRLVTRTEAGTLVKDVELDHNSQATITIGEGEKGVLVVLGAALYTDEPAYYRIRLSRK